jgi:hypothetical protein
VAGDGVPDEAPASPESSHAYPPQRAPGGRPGGRPAAV